MQTVLPARHLEASWQIQRIFHASMTCFCAGCSTSPVIWKQSAWADDSLTTDVFFCNLALGVGEGEGASSLPLTYPSVGLLRALEQQISASSSQATATIRRIAAMHLTKQNLTDLAQSMKYANISFSLFNEAVVKEAVAKLWVKNRPHIDTVESIRHLLFVSVSVLAGLGAIIGWAAFLRTRYKYAKMGEDPHARPPSGRLHLVSWCCAFLHTFLALTLGSSLFILTVPVAETCVFVRSELLYFRRFGKVCFCLRRLPDR